MRPYAAALVALLAVPSILPAQDKPEDRQIADALSPLPDTLRAGARVLGYRAGKLAVIRSGSGEMVCLADDPAEKGFNVACYHRALEPFMALGRELRAQGLARPGIDSARLAAATAGTLEMPGQPAALYSLRHPDDAFDPRGGVPPETAGLYVIYMPYATEATTGISTVPARDRPWLMYPGAPWAHVMISR
jgi:hypothetical protein